MVLAIILILANLSLFFLAISTVVIFKISTLRRKPGLGRIVVWSLFTIKFWEALYLIYVDYAFFFRPPQYTRNTILLGLASYIFIQSLSVNVALYRMRFPFDNVLTALIRIGKAPYDYTTRYIQKYNKD